MRAKQFISIFSIDAKRKKNEQTNDRIVPLVDNMFAISLSSSNWTAFSVSGNLILYVKSFFFSTVLIQKIAFFEMFKL